MPTSQSFTVTHEARVNVLKTQCVISAAFDPKSPPNPLPALIEFCAIWDTGASATVITQGVVDKLGLIPTGMMLVHTAGGDNQVYTYLVNVMLPNAVGFSGVQVTCCPLTGTDVLIGMDIIGSGDFATSTLDGKTVMSFRMPSSKTIDFVTEHRTDEQKEIAAALIKKRPKKDRKKRGR